MRVKTVSISYSRKFNLGQYNSADISVAYWATVEPEEDPLEVTTRLMDAAKDEVKAHAAPLFKKNGNGYAATDIVQAADERRVTIDSAPAVPAEGV